MAPASLFSSDGRFSDWRLAAQSIIGFWAFYLVTVLLRGMFSDEAAAAMSFRAINAGVGLILTVLIYIAIRLIARDGTVRQMALTAAVTALPAAILMATLSLQLATIVDPMGQETSEIHTKEGVAIVQRGSNVRIVPEDGNEIEVNLPPMQDMMKDRLPRIIADATVTWYFLLATWCAFFIAMTEQRRTRIAESRAAAAETAAPSPSTTSTSSPAPPSSETSTPPPPPSASHP